MSSIIFRIRFFYFIAISKSNIKSCLVKTTPAKISLCPTRYLVALCNTISIPKSIGFLFIGDANVLSIIEMIFLNLQILLNTYFTKSLLPIIYR